MFGYLHPLIQSIKWLLWKSVWYLDSLRLLPYSTCHLNEMIWTSLLGFLEPCRLCTSYYSLKISNISAHEHTGLIMKNSQCRGQPPDMWEVKKVGAWMSWCLNFFLYQASISFSSKSLGEHSISAHRANSFEISKAWHFTNISTGPGPNLKW